MSSATVQVEIGGGIKCDVKFGVDSVNSTTNIVNANGYNEASLALIKIAIAKLHQSLQHNYTLPTPHEHNKGTDAMLSNDGLPPPPPTPHEYNKHKPKKSKDSALRGSMSLTIEEQAIAIHIDDVGVGTYNTVLVSALFALRNIANSHKGSGYPTLRDAMKDLNIREKVFNIAHEECKGDGYSFNRVSVAGTDKCKERPHTLVKYDE